MGQTTDQIAADIQDRRDALRSNLHELENKAKSVTDWKQHFEKHPGIMVAAAIGAGALVATISAGRKRRPARGMSAAEPRASTRLPRKAIAQRAGGALQAWGPIKGALIGLAVTRINGFLEELLPGFQEQLKKNGRVKDESSSPSGSPQDSGVPRNRKA